MWPWPVTGLGGVAAVSLAILSLEERFFGGQDGCWCWCNYSMLFLREETNCMEPE